jgi:cell division protein FtsB
MRGLRILLVLLLVLLAWLQYRLWFGSGGQREVAALETRVQAQARDNAGLQQRNDALAAEVEDLKSGAAAVEERARNELGMIKPGETFYRVVEPEATRPVQPAAEGEDEDEDEAATEPAP